MFFLSFNIVDEPFPVAYDGTIEGVDGKIYTRFDILQHF